MSKRTLLLIYSLLLLVMVCLNEMERRTLKRAIAALQACQGAPLVSVGVARNTRSHARNGARRIAGNQ